MVAVPIMALAGGAIVIKTVMPTPRQLAAEAMGTADIRLLGWSSDLRPKELLRRLPAGTRIISDTTVYTQNIVRGSVLYLPVEEFSTRIDRAPIQGRFVMLDGRAPTTAGEAAVQPDVLSTFGARIGDEIYLEDAGLTLRVTGTVVAPDQIREKIAVVGVGTLAGQADAGIGGFLIDLPPGASLDQATAALDTWMAELSVKYGNSLIGYQTRDDVAHMDDGASTAANGGAFAAAAAALFGTGLIAAAAFVVGFRRQLRMLGLVGAQGGEPRHVRAVVLFGGVSLGLVGACVGVALGIAGSLALHPHLTRIAGRLIGPVQLPFLPLLGSVALGTAAATAAALGPARSAARLTTLEALAGRTPPPRKPGRLAGAGLVGVAAGVVLTAWGTAGHANPVLTAGLLLMVAGFLVAIPLLVSGVGRLARYLPTIPRLSARDLARNGRRTGAAIAAATIALALPVAVSVVTLSDEAAERAYPYMAEDQLSISLFAPGGNVERRTQELIAEFRAAFPSSIVVPLAPAGLSADGQTANGAASSSAVYAQGGTEVVREGVAFIRSGALLVGGADLLRAFHAEEGIPALEAGKVVAVGPHTTDGGLVHLVIEEEDGERPLMDLPAVEAGGARYASLSDSEFNYVISPTAAARAGLVPIAPTDQSVHLVLRAAGSLTREDVARAKATAAKHPGAFVLSLSDIGSHGGSVRTILSLCGAGIALAILAVVLALVGAESRRDRAILVAVGAQPRTRRQLAGANGLLIAALAGVLAVPAGFAPAAVYQVSRQIGKPIVVPWAAIALVLICVPLVAGALAALTSRQPDAARMLRPLA
jgi:putative ABC transport system permease protein